MATFKDFIKAQNKQTKSFIKMEDSANLELKTFLAPWG